MKVAIIGTRGIPNHYGGFEQFAENISVGLVRMGYEITVYNSHNHPYKSDKYLGVNIIHCKDPEEKIGTIGQFIYDMNCIIDSRKRNFDIILQLGYTSSSIWSFLFSKKTLITTNMDGLEWKRTKYSNIVQTFLKYAEKLAVKNSNHLISDSIGIQEYLKNKYNAQSTYIPYGANIFLSPDKNEILKHNIQEYNYDLLIARLEPENSIEIILDGASKSFSKRKFLVIGNHKTKYGEYLKNKYKLNKKIKFLGGIYDLNILNNLRYYSNLYFHGHTVGGTNPSLLEAMASSTLICANDNIFNKAILQNDAYYFKTENDVSHIIDQNIEKLNNKFIYNNIEKIKTKFNWQIIINEYDNHFKIINNVK
jgi:hypothetical protein